MKSLCHELNNVDWFYGNTLTCSTKCFANDKKLFSHSIQQLIHFLESLIEYISSKRLCSLSTNTVIFIFFSEGTLTKQPSSALTDLISKYKNSGQAAYTSTNYSESLGEFFTVGVKNQFTERTLTPRKEKPSAPGAPLKKHQMSNKGRYSG